ncbi:hypothetical protein ACVWZW_008640 [Bradyrhizobium sp. F1.13.4]
MAHPVRRVAGRRDLRRDRHGRRRISRTYPGQPRARAGKYGAADRAALRSAIRRLRRRRCRCDRADESAGDQFGRDVPRAHVRTRDEPDAAQQDRPGVLPRRHRDLRCRRRTDQLVAGPAAAQDQHLLARLLSDLQIESDGRTGGAGIGPQLHHRKMDHDCRASAERRGRQLLRHDGPPDRSGQLPELFRVRCACRGHGDLAVRPQWQDAVALPACRRADRQGLQGRAADAQDACRRWPAHPARQGPDRRRRAPRLRGLAVAFPAGHRRDQHHESRAGRLAAADRLHGHHRRAFGHGDCADPVSDRSPDQPAESRGAATAGGGARAARHRLEQHVARVDPVRCRRIHRHLQPPLRRHVRPLSRCHQARLSHPRGDVSSQGARRVRRRCRGILRRRHEDRRRGHGLHENPSIAEWPRFPGHQHPARAGRMGGHDRRHHRAPQAGAGTRPQLHVPARDYRPHPVADHGEGCSHAAISVGQPDRRRAIRPIRRKHRWQDPLRHIPGCLRQNRHRRR